MNKILYFVATALKNSLLDSSVAMYSGKLGSNNFST